jgi:hypothetical protein
LRISTCFCRSAASFSAFCRRSLSSCSSAACSSLASSSAASGCEALLRFEDAAGFLTAARAETGVPLAPPRTDRVLETPLVPFVVGVEERAGVRFAAAGDDEVVLVLASRRGVPGGLVAAAADMLFVFSLSKVKRVPETRSWQRRSNKCAVTCAEQWGCVALIDVWSGNVQL